MAAARWAVPGASPSSGLTPNAPSAAPADPGEPGARGAHYLWRQAGGVAAGALFVVLAYAAWRGKFAHPTFLYLGGINSASVGRLLFAHDALATEAVGVLILVALVGATAVWRVRDRSR